MNSHLNKRLILIGFAISIAVIPFISNQQSIEVGSQVSSQESSETKASQPIVVQVQGAVAKPGIYEMTSGQRIDDLLRIAEVKSYNQSCLNLAQKLVDEQNLYVPATDEPCVEDRSITDDGVVNINTASNLELQTLPGIGEAKAAAIVDYREVNGTFENPQELLAVDGISEGLLSDIQPLISLS